MNGSRRGAAPGLLHALGAGRLSIRVVLTGLAAGAVVALLAVYIAASAAASAVLRRVEMERATSSVERARNILERRALTRNATVQEFSAWTDTWEYIARPRGPAAERFIQDNFVGWLPRQYGDRYIAIRSRDRRPVMVWADSSARGAEAAFANPALFDLLDARKSVGGYLGTPRGLFIVAAGVVVRSEDYDATGERRGYLVLGAPLTDSLVDVVASEFQERLAFLPPDPSLRPDTFLTRTTAGGDSAESRFALADILGRPVATVALQSSRAFVTNLRRWAQNVFLGALLVGGLVLALGWLVANRIVVRPTREIAAALDDMQLSGALRPLDQEPPSHEWGQLVAAFNRTVEALRSSEAALRHAQKMEAIGTLAGGIAHDFNNLIGAVLASASFVRDDVGPTHPSLAAIETIERASKRAAELTGQLLRFARRGQFRVAPTDLNAVVGNVARICARTFDRSIRVETQLEPWVALVNADAGQLEQAVLSLCLNGRDAMPEGGVLTLATRRVELDRRAAQAIPVPAAGPYVVASVADTGAGMSAEIRQRLFEPFFTTKERGRGTGLGLAMVYGIVTGHGGGIVVESAPGAGTRLDAYLPALDVPEASALAAGTATAVPRGTETILVIDDEQDLREAMCRILRYLGYTVVEAENGRVGLERFDEIGDRVALVVLDVIMPEMGGVETFKQLRARRPELPVLVCSGYSAPNDIQVLLDLGATAFLPKPFDAIELGREVRRILDGVPPPEPAAPIGPGAPAPPPQGGDPASG